MLTRYAPRALMQGTHRAARFSAMTRTPLAYPTMAARFQSSSSTPPPAEVSTRINDMMDSFAEARALINDALESAGTTYFEDDIEEAMRETKLTLQMWSDLQAYLKEKGDEATLSSLLKENEMKMKQLAEELEAARDAGED